MSNPYAFMRKWLPYSFVFMLFACGGGGGDDELDAAGANDAVITANSTVPENVFTATLDAAQQDPSISSTATGIGIVMVDPSNRLMRATLTTAGIIGSSANIHIARSGTAGPAVFPLVETAAASGVWSAQTTLTDEQLTALRSGNYYFNVGSGAFPDGEIRGRIVPQLPASGLTATGGTGVGASTVNNGNFTSGSANARTSIGAAGGNASGNSTTSSTTSSTTRTTIGPSGQETFGTAGDPGTGLSGTITGRTTYVNVLTGAQQIPANGSRAIAIGVAIVDSANRTMVASITSLGIAGLGAHIHRAASGSNGDTVFSLNETSAGSGIWAARAALSDLQLNAFTSGSYYFDIHTAAFPNGEIRGQMVASAGTGAFGTGSAGIPANTGSGIGTTSDTGTSPFVSGTGTANTGNSATGNTGTSVPTFGNPIGSGVGSGTSFTTDIPTLGNPAGSGIGSAGDAGFGDASVSSLTGSGVGTAF